VYRQLWAMIIALCLAACANQQAPTPTIESSGVRPTEQPTAEPTKPVLLSKAALTNNTGAALCGLSLAAETAAEWGDNILRGTLKPGEVFTVDSLAAGNYLVRANLCVGGAGYLYHVMDVSPDSVVIVDLYEPDETLRISNLMGEPVCDVIIDPLFGAPPLPDLLQPDEQLAVQEYRTISLDRAGDYKVTGTTCSGKFVEETLTIRNVEAESYIALEVEEFTSLTVINDGTDQLCTINMQPDPVISWGVNYLSVPLNPGQTLTIQDLHLTNHRVRIMDCNENIVFWQEAYLPGGELSIGDAEHIVTVLNFTGKPFCDVRMGDDAWFNLLDFGETIETGYKRSFASPAGDVSVHIQDCDGIASEHTVTVASEVFLPVNPPLE